MIRLTLDKITWKLSLSRTSTPSSKVISALVVVKEETRSRKERAGNSMVCKGVQSWWGEAIFNDKAEDVCKRRRLDKRMQVDCHCSR